MARTPEIVVGGDETAAGDETTTTGAAVGNGNGDIGFRSNHDRYLFKRNHPPPNLAAKSSSISTSDRVVSNRHRMRRKAIIQLKANSVIYSVILLAVFGFAFASMVLQSSITSIFRPGGRVNGHNSRRGLIYGSSLRFLPHQRFLVDGKLDSLRNLPLFGVRPPRLAVILRNTKKNPESLMLFTVMKNLRRVGYVLKLYALEDGEARPLWEELGQMTILNLERYGHIDWSLFEGVIADSLEAKEVLSSLMQEPFCSVPLVWIIQEDTLGKWLHHYNLMGWDNLISRWRQAFGRADVVVFPDFSLPMLYSMLDNGNFYVIPGSPMDVWAVESYVKTHSKYDLRKTSAYSTDDVLVLVVGSPIFFNELSWDYAAVLHTIGPLLIKYGKGQDVDGSFKFMFLCGNSTDQCNEALEDVSMRLGLSSSSLRHYSMDHDVNEVLSMADIVLYGSSHDEQAFPSLLKRAMSFGIPVIAPDLAVIKKYVVDGVHGMIFSKNTPVDLLRVFSLLISNEGKLSKFAEAVGSTGKLLARNLLAFESITGYVKLMENVLHFPSDVLLPSPVSQVKQYSWEWDSFSELMGQTAGDIMNIDNGGNRIEESSIIITLENIDRVVAVRNVSEDSSDVAEQVCVSMEDLDAVEQILTYEEFERLEMDQIHERLEKDPGIWDEIYKNARKSEKLKFESNERDEGELERIGRLVSIYEVYNGVGSWPFLHRGSLYRGLSLSRRARRLSSDDVDAVYRLPFLNNSHYRDLLCQMGGLFSIAYKVDEIHRRPWIGFQSWQASGRKASLSTQAETVIEETIQRQTKGDTVYFWARLDMDGAFTGMNGSLSFWSMCDALNGGHCRTAFQNAFRHMYGLPPNIEALPPMPKDHDYWSALQCWFMPTSSFLEFVMFSRMFVDSLDALHRHTVGSTQCLLGFSELERKHCYCRVLDLLINVWAYHSSRRMVYLDPHTGMLKEQHPVEHRKGSMWVKYFNFTLLKSMDEDLAEAADDGDQQREAWLWPLTGEVHWQGKYDREREQRYRIKMDKKRKVKEKLFDRMKYGYRQKSVGG